MGSKEATCKFRMIGRVASSQTALYSGTFCSFGQFSSISDLVGPKWIRRQRFDFLEALVPGVAGKSGSL